MSYYEVDCVKCAYYKDDTVCMECIHNPFYEDYFMPATPEMVEKLRQENIRNFISEIPKDEVTTNIPAEFLEGVKKVWRFVPDPEEKNYKFYFVYCGNDALMASDTKRIIKLYMDVPSEFVGKYVLWDGHENKLYTRKNTNCTLMDCADVFENGTAQRLFDEARNGEKLITTKADIPIWEKESEFVEPRVVLYERRVVLNERVVINKSYLDDILDLIPEGQNINITIRGQHDAVRFDTDGFEALVMPIREPIKEGNDKNAC